jgi:hypothetical protein
LAPRIVSGPFLEGIMTFERGEMVGLMLAEETVTFIVADGDEAWVRFANGGHATVPYGNLRKLPPPFAVVNETCTCGAMLCVGEAQIYYAECEIACRVAEKINAAFAARLADRDANIEQMRSALVALSKLGNGDRVGNSEGNVIAKRALEAFNVCK